MAKDPAINWYFDNWSGGVKGFTRHQKGCYMDLLESQFYLGHLSLDQIKNILGADFSQWPSLQGKFTQDERGNFFNERLELEKNKRMKYSESRANNRKKKDMSNISKTYEKHMKNTPGIETETETVFDLEKGVQGEKQIELGKVNGHRMIVQRQFVHDDIFVLNGSDGLMEYFTIRGQIESILLQGWKDFEGFCKENPGAIFTGGSHLYNSFKKYSLRAAQPARQLTDREIKLNRLKQ